MDTDDAVNGQESAEYASQCKICGAPARSSFFGTIACAPCKMFFKRNGEKGQAALKCDLDGHCEINVNNRHTCSCCRLAKCFTNGMCTEMIRSSISKKLNPKKKQQQQQHVAVADASRALARSGQAAQPAQLPTLNLLRTDQSSFNADQWNLLSNLIHCFDEHSGYAHAERFISEQNILPIKARYKSAPVGEFIQSVVHRAQSLFEKNRDFLTLPPRDRSSLLRTKASYVASLSFHLILREVHLMQHPIFLQSLINLFGPAATQLGERISSQVDSDAIITKLTLAIVCFSTITFAIYSNEPPENLTNLKNILRIQETYTELLWRYLLYKYNHQHAVIRFINVIRCLFSIQDGITSVFEAQYFSDIIASLVGQTELALVVHN